MCWSVRWAQQARLAVFRPDGQASGPVRRVELQAPEATSTVTAQVPTSSCGVARVQLELLDLEGLWRAHSQEVRVLPRAARVDVCERGPGLAHVQIEGCTPRMWSVPARRLSGVLHGSEFEVRHHALAPLEVLIHVLDDEGQPQVVAKRLPAFKPTWRAWRPGARPPAAEGARAKEAHAAGANVVDV